ncbi:MAG TPA: hypothetical protein VMU84_19140 [Thermoanaerobaculia bacterium]|nr:hypothetical protein [Thermoanaerobaculia bacterium]
MNALVLAVLLLAQTRIASDFEIAQMEKQLATSKNFLAQLSGRLNLGDVRAARNERSLARTEYAKAFDLASNERIDARRDSDMTRYATATAYAALAKAKLGDDARAFELLEESIRYTSDSAKTWNLYASAMTVLGRPRKAVAAARNAVALADEPLDLRVYQHALASALIDAGDTAEAERLLVTVTEALRSKQFASLREDVARQESFEIYSTARGDAAAYLSLLNRAQLRLAALYEKRGDDANARVQYQRVLDARSDDATALAGLARLAKSDTERERYFADAFDANPFSMTLIREYRKHVPSADIDDSTTGGKMRRAIAQLVHGENRAARATIDALLAQFPDNETLKTLRRETESQPVANLSDLRALLTSFEQLTPEQRVALDRMTFTSIVQFDGETGTTFESGTIDGVPFRFSEPTIFAGTFAPRARLTYRVLGVAGDVLLLEPVKLEAL